jgi:ribosomal protein S18 acetylase RimI-like enzyme
MVRVYTSSFGGGDWGKALMTASLVRAAQNKMATVILEVDIENHRAIALYEQLGFRKRRGSISHIWTAK